MNLNYTDAAKLLRCEPEAIQAVDAVESNGGGMQDGKPIILFEPHIFWKQLRAQGVDPNKYVSTHGDMLYPVWGTKPYPKGQAAQWERMDRAVSIHREAALQSASWGRYQICGFNYKSCRCVSVQEFVNEMYKGDEAHLNLFVQYILSNHLDDELRNLDWPGLARAYNGPLYAKNNYDKRLSAAYQKAKKIA